MLPSMVGQIGISMLIPIVKHRTCECSNALQDYTGQWRGKNAVGLVTLIQPMLSSNVITTSLLYIASLPESSLKYTSIYTPHKLYTQTIRIQISSETLVKVKHKYCEITKKLPQEKIGAIRLSVGAKTIETKICKSITEATPGLWLVANLIILTTALRAIDCCVAFNVVYR